jgi:hypothetical protein
MSKVEDAIRSFGLSGMLVLEDLTAIEQSYGVALGHSPKTIGSSSLSYYPQFENSVRREAADMARQYELFYCLEKAIRKLISDNLQDASGADWWNSQRVPDVVKKGVADRVKRDVDSGMTRRSDAAIDYTNFGELSVLIGSNWDVFSNILKSQRAVERVLNNLNLLRGPIAHCCPISEDEVQRLELSVRDWFRMIG